MDFFARQERARAQTRELVVLFALSVTVVVVVLTAVLVAILATWAKQGALLEHPAQWLVANAPLVLGCALAVLAIVAAGSGLKSMQLAAGGSTVARLMGADRVDPNTRDPLRKRLVNVVEEMAIASGVPVPAVYVMEGERGLNAFAAGFSPADSCVTVTQGALETFDREELQGVIGHEFSHILNGDMRLNMRLLAMVAGLFALTTVGRLLMRGGSRSRKGGGLVVMGLAMFVLGGIGMLLGRMIQAAISRQREYLADASAVQFTRDPRGLRDALVKIGAREGGGRVATDEAHEVAHMLFASGFSETFATHPPIGDRIRALDPAFGPDEFERVAKELEASRPAPKPAEHTPAAAKLAGLASATVAATIAADGVARNVGRPRLPHVRYAGLLRAALPEPLAADTADPAGARALLAALLWTGGAGGDTAGTIAAAFGADTATAAAAKREAVAALPGNQRLPLLLQLVPALGRLPQADREALVAAIDRVVRADGTITLSEYALARLARVHLAAQVAPPPLAGTATLRQLETELQVVCAVLAHAGTTDEAAARDACERGLTRALPGRPTPFAPPRDWVPALDEALDRLDTLRPAEKERLVDAIGLVVAADGTLALAEAELLRAICGSLHCPLPPLIEAPEAA